MKIQILQDILDFIRGKKKLAKCSFLKYTLIDSIYLKGKNKYPKIVEKICEKDKLRVGFYVIFDSMFPARPIFEAMLNDDSFEPFIVVIPDTSRGAEWMLAQIDKTYSSLSHDCSNVYMAHDKIKDEFIDFRDTIDLVCPASPYDGITHEYYRISNLHNHDVLPFYISYWYPALLYAEYVFSLPLMHLMWKIFAETSYISNIYPESIRGNVIVAGSVKMDRLARQTMHLRSRKSIIIAPHHSVAEFWSEFPPIGNFLTYYQFFMELPAKYPNIDFIFRPHPLLILDLERQDIWGKEKTKEYFRQIQLYPNLVYQDGGDYFETFANSDGIIHDCASFLSEYMFTEKPTCYLLKDKKAIDTLFMQNGKETLSHCYQAYNEMQIIDFIDKVVVDGLDTQREERIHFVRQNIMINYPEVSKFILGVIKKALKK